MNRYIQGLHNALCETCTMCGNEHCDTCEFKRPISFSQYHSYVVTEEVIEPGKIISQTLDVLTFFILNDQIVAVTDCDTFLKLADVPWEDVEVFFDHAVIDYMVTKKIWDQEKVHGELDESGYLHEEDA